MMRFLKYFLVFIVCIILFPFVTYFFKIAIGLKLREDEQHQMRWNTAHHFDQQAFLNLSEPIFYFKRMHVGDSGAWVMVYPLNEQTKQDFLLRWQESESKKIQSIECIKPTIKKRWRTWHSNIHYVQPDEWSKDHRDHQVHDSFIVYGSEKYIKTIEQGCRATEFKVLRGDNQLAHRYWAISEKEHLLFSVYDIN